MTSRSRVTRRSPLLFVVFLVSPFPVHAQETPDPVAHFDFNGTVTSSSYSLRTPEGSGRPSFVGGLAGEALRLGPETSATFLTLGSDLMSLDSRGDFSVQFWVRTTAGADR